MSATHVTAAATWDGERLRLTDPMVFSAGMKKLKPGAGETFFIRIEREAEARKRHQEKWYFGYIVEQCIAYTGETAKERDEDFRARFLPPDCKTYSDMNYEQAADYAIQCEIFAAETIGVVVKGPDDALTWAD